MASSVSSERAFSSAGLTVTKLRNRLKGDIVEATQTLKFAIRTDLLVRAPEPSSSLEALIEEEEAEELALGNTGVSPSILDPYINLELSLDSDAEESDAIELDI